MVLYRENRERQKREKERKVGNRKENKKREEKETKFHIQGFPFPKGKNQREEGVNIWIQICCKNHGYFVK